MDPFHIFMLGIYGIVLIVLLAVIYRLFHSAEEEYGEGLAWALAALVCLSLVMVYFGFPIDIIGNQTGTYIFIGFVLIALILIFILARGKKAPGRGTHSSALDPAKYDIKDLPSAHGPAPPSGDPEFHDDELDELIENGRLRDARKYLADMIRLARDMGDNEGVRNYKQYELRITKAAMTGLKKKDED